MEKEVVQKLAKVELHCHLDGSVRPTILREIARQQQRPLTCTDEKLVQLMSVSDECESLLEYLDKFDIVLEYLQTKEALELVAYDLISEVSKEQVIYIEVRFAPDLFARKGLTITEVIEAVSKGLQRGKKVFGVQSNMLLCGMKHHSVEQNQKIVQASKNFLKQGVVGFDLAGDEANNPTENFSELISLANDYGIPLTLHAGECGCVRNIKESIDLGATRIGHGVAMQGHPDLLHTCAEKEITIEMCPISNLHTKAISSNETYPFLEFLHAGVSVTINTDNRTVSNTTLTKEYMTLHEWFGIDYACMKQLNLNSVTGAFISTQEKEELAAVIETSYKAYV